MSRRSDVGVGRGIGGRRRRGFVAAEPLLAADDFLAPRALEDPLAGLGVIMGDPPVVEMVDDGLTRDGVQSEACVAEPLRKFGHLATAFIERLIEAVDAKKIFAPDGEIIAVNGLVVILRNDRPWKPQALSQTINTATEKPSHRTKLLRRQTADVTRAHAGPTALKKNLDARVALMVLDEVRVEQAIAVDENNVVAGRRAESAIQDGRPAPALFRISHALHIESEAGGPFGDGLSDLVVIAVIGDDDLDGRAGLPLDGREREVERVLTFRCAHDE